MVKDIVKGVIIGALIPLVLVGLTFLFFKAFNRTLKMEVIVPMLLFGIGVNMLFVRRLFKKNKDYLGRGMVITCFLLSFYILAQYVSIF